MPFDFESYKIEAKKRNHSDYFIESTIRYAQKLKEKELPVIFSTTHLELLMGLPRDLLRDTIQNKDQHYSQFIIKKKRGNKNKCRDIQAPSETLKYIQRWINKNILEKIPLSDSCIAYRSNYSIKQNAEIHASSQIILKIDLLKFYDTINERRVFGFFKGLGYSPNVALDLAKITTINHDPDYWIFHPLSGKVKLSRSIQDGVLPQGAPTSPLIANQIAKGLDVKFGALAEKMRFRYSRYADDMTFSLKNEGELPSFGLVKKIVRQQGFYINFDKVGYYKSGMKQYVTGLTVTNNVHVSKKNRKEIYTHLYFAKKYGPQEHMKEWSKRKQVRNYNNFQDWLLGKISFVYSIDPKEGIKMMQQYKLIEWSF